MQCVGSAHGVGSVVLHVVRCSVKSSTFGINWRRHLCAAVCRDRADGMQDWALLLPPPVFVSSPLAGSRPPAPCRGWGALPEVIREQSGTCTPCLPSFPPVMGLWWARRGQDARQRRRLTEAQRLHPSVHGRLPPGRLDLPLLRLHVSTIRDMTRSWLRACKQAPQKTHLLFFIYCVLEVFIT